MAERGERLSLGVAARLSRYLQVLTQAKKMGKETISSQELADYTHVNSTQIRRDLSGFGKFGKRGVGYNVDSLVSQIRKILRTTGKHNIALFGAGKLGQAIAGSDIFADHGFRVVAIFDTDPKKLGKRVGNSLVVRPNEELRQVVGEEDEVLAQSLVGELIESEVEIRSGRGESFADATGRQREARSRLFGLAAERGVLLAATGTHPWSPWQEQRIIDTDHYRRVEEGLM